MSYVNVISWRNINNAGDEVIGTITSEMISSNSRIETRQTQLYPGIHDLIANHSLFRLFFSNVLLLIAKLFLRRDRQYKLKKIAYTFRLKKYFDNELRDSKGVIYAVGMLKFASQNQSFFFEVVNDIALEKNIPVVISGVSVAYPDESDWRFRQLKKVINYPIVKMISTRDGSKGVELLRNNYITNPNIMIIPIGDPALLLKDFYEIQEPKEKHKVGIGLIRKKIFDNYGQEISGNDLRAIYCDLIDILESKKIDWQLFCNGMADDYKFGIELLKMNNLPSYRLAGRPGNAKDLISLINGYEVVIAARLHASIIATALGKPVTGFNWEDKVRCFARESNQLCYYLEIDELNAKNIYKNYLEIGNKTQDNDRLDNLREDTKRSFEIIGDIINEQKKGQCDCSGI